MALLGLSLQPTLLQALRLATTHKLKNKWGKRLDNNSLAVGRLQQNRNLWIKAGGCDPELLATPMEHHMEQVAKTVET